LVGNVFLTQFHPKLSIAGSAFRFKQSFDFALTPTPLNIDNRFPFYLSIRPGVFLLPPLFL
jgi:hypothetical protein